MMRLLLLVFLFSSCNILQFLNGNETSKPNNKFYNFGTNGNNTNSTSVPTVIATEGYYEESIRVLDQDTAMEPLYLLTNGVVDSASISPALPAGLVIDGTTGTISGTPTAQIGETAYTVTVNSNFTVQVSLKVMDAYVVDSTLNTADNNPGDGICDDGAGNCTLKAAFQENNDGTSIRPIYIKAGTYTIDARLDINRSFSIHGAGKYVTIFDGQGATYGAFLVDDTLGSTSTEMSGFTVTDHHHTGGGGVISATSSNVISINLKELIFDSNSATTDGGAIYLGGTNTTITANRVRILNNSANNAGAIYLNAGIINFSEVEFYNNSATTSTGAVYGITGTGNISKSLFFMNSGPDGGAINSGGAGFNLDDNTFVNNSSNTGGAIHLAGGTTNINSSTFYNNTVSGTATGAALKQVSGTMNIKGNIFAENRDINSDIDTCSGTINDGNYNLEDADTCAFATNGFGNATLNLGVFGDYGGFTNTIPIEPGSDAIDLGVTGCSAADQRNKTRDASCDAGAYEF